MTDTSNTTKSQPIFRKLLPGGISAAVFQNTRDGKTYRSINLQRSYRQNGKWNRMSLYLDHEHIPFMQEALEATWRFMTDFPVSAQSTQPDAETASPQPADLDDAAA